MGPVDEPLVGRDDLLAELVAAAHDARLGAGSIVLLTGEAGIGKSSVVRALARSVSSELEVSWGSCIPDQSAPPLWPWRGVVPTESPTIVRDHGGSAVGAMRFELLTALRDDLVERARRGPMLHVIEDLQWADVTSVLLLAHLGGGILDLPVMVVGTLRTGEPLGTQLDEAIEEVRRIARVRPVRSLRVDEVEALMRAAGVAPDGELTALVRDRTGGNPLFVTELLRSVRAADPADRVSDIAAGTVPTRVSELVVGRLGRLPDAVVDLVVAASVVGTEGSARTLAAVRRSGLEPVLDLIEQARAARLFDAAGPGRWRFLHDLVRDAVAASATDATRARLHAEVLDALAVDASTPPAVLARHALAAQPLLDAERAVALAARAGEWALDHHGYEEAVSWFERALAAAPIDITPRWRADLLVRCGDAYRHIGQTDEARRAFVVAAECSEDPSLLTHAALGYADPGADLGIAYRTDDPTTSALLHAAIAAQPADDSVATILLESRLAAELYFSDTPARARALADSAVERARRLDDRRALGAATAVFHDAFVVGQAELDAQLRGSEQLLDWAIADGTPAALLTAHRARVFDLLAAGDLVGVDREVLAFRRIAEPLGAPGSLWWLSLWSAMRALLEGHHAAAEERAVAACEIGSRPFPSLAFVNLSFLLFFLRREQGRLVEMEDAVRDAASAQADIPAIRVALAVLLAEIGRMDEARGMLGALSEDDLVRLRDRNWPASWFQLARATSIVGDRALAERLLDERTRPTERCVTVSLATVCLGATDLATAWLLHALGRLDAAHERYSAAATLNAALGARAWLAQTRADHAHLLLDRNADGDREAACELGELSADAADDIGLASVGPTLERLRARLDPTNTPSAAATVRPSVFRRAGALWEVDYAGRTVRIPHGRALCDLAVLLARPDQEVSVLDLVGEPGSAPDEARGEPVFDERARREIRDRLHELDTEVADAEAIGDAERSAIARELRQQLAETVTRDLGLGGRPRRIGDPVERARKTVSTRIRRGVAAVARSHPELGRHLERSIDTGTFCAYRPAEPTTWIT